MESHDDVLSNWAGLTRRQFVSRMGAGGALLAAGSLGVAPLRAHAARSAVQPINVTWTNVALPTNIDPALGFDSDTLMSSATSTRACWSTCPAARQSGPR